MMRMSKKFRYGLRATVDLALQKAWRGSPALPVPLNSIVKRQGIPEPFLRQIFHVLRKARLVEAVMGKAGGYRLMRDPKRVSALDVARAVGDEMVPVPCVVNRAACCSVRKCSTHALLSRVSALLEKALSDTSIARLALCQTGRNSREKDGNLLGF
jgi:Rrf2 family iron-sulfur cluster assembly transcriptional regulator